MHRRPWGRSCTTLRAYRLVERTLSGRRCHVMIIHLRHDTNFGLGQGIVDLEDRGLRFWDGGRPRRLLSSHCLTQSPRYVGCRQRRRSWRTAEMMNKTSESTTHANLTRFRVTQTVPRGLKHVLLSIEPRHCARALAWSTFRTLNVGVPSSSRGIRTLCTMRCTLHGYPRTLRDSYVRLVSLASPLIRLHPATRRLCWLLSS